MAHIRVHRLDLLREILLRRRPVEDESRSLADKDTRKASAIKPYGSINIIGEACA